MAVSIISLNRVPKLSPEIHESQDALHALQLHTHDSVTGAFLLSQLCRPLRPPETGVPLTVLGGRGRSRYHRERRQSASGRSRQRTDFLPARMVRELERRQKGTARGIARDASVSGGQR
jgi:hypothetical protein